MPTLQEERLRYLYLRKTLTFYNKKELNNSIENFRHEIITLFNVKKEDFITVTTKMFTIKRMGDNPLKCLVC